MKRSYTMSGPYGKIPFFPREERAWKGVCTLSGLNGVTFPAMFLAVLVRIVSENGIRIPFKDSWATLKSGHTCGEEPTEVTMGVPPLPSGTVVTIGGQRT
jgi:hypothetical protein